MLSLQRSQAVARPAGRRVAPVSRSRVVRVAASTQFDTKWLKPNPLVLGAALAGWIVPSSIPVSAFGNESLFGAFNAAIGRELAHWPTGPALESDFWVLLLTWHMGLFLVMTLGQIGFNGRNQGYFQ